MSDRAGVLGGIARKIVQVLTPAGVVGLAELVPARLGEAAPSGVEQSNGGAGGRRLERQAHMRRHSPVVVGPAPADPLRRVVFVDATGSDHLPPALRSDLAELATGPGIQAHM